MKKNIFKKLGGAFLGLALGLGVVAGVASAPKASEVKADELSLSGFGSQLTSSSASGTMTISGYDITYGAAKKQDSAAFLASGSGFMANATAMPGAINSITVYANSGASGTCAYHVKFGTSAFSAFTTTGTQSSTIAGGSSQKFTNSVTGATYFVISCASKNGQVLQIDVDYTAGGTPTTNYTVTFDVQGHGTAPQAATVASGGKVTKPTDPSASGYTFGGWYKETGCTTAWVFETDTVSKDTTIYAKWTENGGGGDTPAGNYTLVTSLSDLKNGDNVVITTGAPADGVTGVTGYNNNKDATVSTKLSEFLEYTVELSGSNYYLKDTGASKYIQSPTGNEFKYGTKGAIAVDDQGHFMCNSRYLCVNNTSYRFYTSIGSYTPFFLYKVGSAAKLVSISTLSATVSARTGDTSWTIADVSVTGVLDDSASVVDISKVVDISVVQSVPEIEQDGTMSVTLKATGKTETTVTKSVTITAALKFCNPYGIENIYSASKGEEVTIDGIYMGDLRDAMIIMDGKYGADIYFGTGKVPAHSYVAGETKLTVKGTIDIYNNLVEVKPVDGGVSVLTDSARISKLETPEVYIVQGTESADDKDLAARKTNATGYVKSITDKSGNKDTVFVVGGQEINMYVGSAFLKEGVLDTLNDSKDNQTEITVEGFTSFFTNFQIQFTGLVEKKADYLAANFAADLLELTDDVCASYDGAANNKEALGNVWLTLQDADHWLGLAGTEQEILAAASASETGTDVEKAMARYDYLVAKYGLTNFIDRSIPSGLRTINFVNSNNNTSTIIIVIVSVVSLTTLGALIMIKRRKTTDK